MCRPGFLNLPLEKLTECTPAHFSSDVPETGNNTTAIGWTAAIGSNTFSIAVADGGADLQLNASAPNSWITLNTGNTERLRVDQHGNVGIGTANPAASLDNAGNSYKRALLFQD
jgi:hypothetical protein